MNADQVQVLPCPFCGSSDLRPEGQRLQASVECLSCGAEGQICRTLPEAITAWNTRHTATADALEVMREAREILRQCPKWLVCLDGHEAGSTTDLLVDRINECLTRLTAAIAKIEGETK